MSELRSKTRRNRIKALSITLAIIAVAVLPDPAFAQIRGGDQIILRGDTRHRNVEIIKEGCDEIAFRLGGARRTVPTTDVVDVVYGNQPTRLVQAKSDIGIGKYKKALAHLEYVINSVGDNSPDWLLPHALYQKGKALNFWGKTDPSRYGQAAETLEKLTQNKDNKGHRLQPMALRLLGDALLGAGEVAEAEKSFKELAAVQCPGPWAIHGKYGQAKIQLKGGDQMKARSLFLDVIKEAGFRPEAQALAGEARLAMGKSWLAEASFKNAIDAFKGAIRAGDETIGSDGGLLPILTKAFNGMGDAYLQRADKFEDAKDYQEALLAYMHVVVLSEEPVSERRHALLQSGKCSTKIGWKDMAKSLFGELKSRYPTSQEAKEAN
ncbi:MAG: hypothetical protein O7H41_16265 [Planctomycetota bacterium]|nr:hypothetical protein [Planctomycetota bacterium]